MHTRLNRIEHAISESGVRALRSIGLLGCRVVGHGGAFKLPELPAVGVITDHGRRLVPLATARHLLEDLLLTRPSEMFPHRVRRCAHS